MSEVKIYKQRTSNKKVLNELLGTAIVQIQLSPFNMVITTKKHKHVLKWETIREAIMIKEVIKSGYPETMSIGLKYLVIKAEEKDFKIDVSSDHAQIEDASDFLIEFIKYKKITGWEKIE